MKKLEQSEISMRCALVEFNPYHRETLATFILLLNQLGIEVDVFVRADTLSRRPLALCPGLRYKARSLDDVSMKLWVHIRRFGGYDLVVANSVEPVWVLRKLVRLRVPILGVTHNPILMVRDPDYRAFFAHSSRSALVLAPHIVSWLGKRAEATWIAPVHIAEDLELNRARSDLLCVQGSIDFRRRNYECLIKAVAELKGAGSAGFSVIVVGNEYELDGIRLRAEVAQRGLEDVIEVIGPKYRYDEYLDTIRAAAFILPLADSTSFLFQPYFGEKITSSLSVAIATARIPVVHTGIAGLYGIEEMAVTYEDGELPDAIRRAMNLTTEERACMVSRLQRRRTSLLEGSLRNLRSAIAGLGLDPGHG